MNLPVPDISSVLSQLGLGVATNAIYDVIKAAFTGTAAPARPALEKEIQDRIDLNGISMRASTVIDALVRNGVLAIRGSTLYAPQAITFGSVVGTAAVGHNSILRTDTTAIEARGEAVLQTQGNAQVRQNPNGSISFHVGEQGSISVKMPR